MAPRSARRARSAASGLAVLGGLAVVVKQLRSLGPAYAVKGAWQGEPSTLTSAAKGDFSTILEGLEPKVNFPAVAYHREGLALSVEDGRLNADYSAKLDDDTTLNLRVNDEQAWKASLLGQDASLRIRGQGADLDSLSWEAAQSSSVEDVGDVQVEFNSDREYNLTVVRQQLAELAGVELGAKVRSSNEGITGRLDARRQLPQGVAASYSVENPIGVYDMGSAKHVGRLSAPVAGGEAVLQAEGDSSAQGYKGSYTRGVAGGRADLQVSHQDGALGYNVSFARGLADVAPVDADVHVGVDEDGLYGKVVAQRDLGRINAEYQASARFNVGEEERKANLAHALKLSNKLGYAQLSHGSDEAPRMRVGYEFNA